MASVICIRRMGIFTGCLSHSAQQWLRRVLPQSSKTAFREQFHHNVRYDVHVELYSLLQSGVHHHQHNMVHLVEGVVHNLLKAGLGFISDKNIVVVTRVVHNFQKINVGFTPDKNMQCKKWKSAVGEVIRVVYQIGYCVFISFCWNLRFYSARRVSLQVTANGVDFHCEQSGYGDHAVLLLPGALGSSTTDFNKQLEKMNPEKFTMFGFDPRGYGRSIPPERDWPVNFRHRDAEDAVAVMNTLGRKKFSVLGWSDGGTTGLILAAQYPEHMRKLVVWGGNAYVTEEDIKIHRGIEDIAHWSAKSKDSYIQLYGEKCFQVHWSNWVKASRNCLTHNKGDICKAEVKNITCPTFILHGMRDPLTIAEHPVYLNKHIKNSRLHNIPEGNHHIHMNRADEFNKMVEDFLLE